MRESREEGEGAGSVSGGRGTLARVHTVALDKCMAARAVSSFGKAVTRRGAICFVSKAGGRGHGQR